MYQFTVQEINKVYRDKNVLIVTEEGACEGIYIGSFLDNHVTLITYCHLEKAAKIQHLNVKSIRSFGSSREIDLRERQTILQYLRLSDN